jgi:hypothetical protein
MIRFATTASCVYSKRTEGLKARVLRSRSWSERKSITRNRRAYGKDVNRSKENKTSKKKSIFPSAS